MMLILIPVIVLALPNVLAASQPASRSSPVHVPLVRHGKSPERMVNMPRAREMFEHRHAFANTDMKRSESAGSVLMTDNEGVYYSGIVNVGTPPQSFNVAIDTGVSSLMLATTACTVCPSNISLFDPSKSSSYQEAGPSDTIAFGGFSLPDQQFLPIENISSTTDPEALSGTMGFGFTSYPYLPTYWHVLYEQNLLPQPVFGLYLERHVNLSGETGTAPGGTLTIGGTDASLYTGNIEFADMPNGTASLYWSQQVQTVTVQGAVITVPSDDNVAEIISGTPFIGVSNSICQQIWAEVPGSTPLTGQYQSMYAFPCTTNVTISMSFGGTDWAIDPADMNFGTVDVNSTQMCLGTIVDMTYFTKDTGPPYWVIGDAFLRNVYSVFQANPPAVGFARLSSTIAGSSTSGAIGDSSFPSMSLSLVVTLLTWFLIIA